MIQTKEELFLAELGINTKEEIELSYGGKIKITDLLKKYENKQCTIHNVVKSLKDNKTLSFDEFIKMKKEDLIYIKNTLNWLLENKQEENPEHAFNIIYNSINKIDEAINFTDSSTQLKTFNCINVIDGYEQCKNQCLFCKTAKGF